MSQDKSSLRSHFLQQRKALSPEVWQTKSKLLCQQLIAQDLFANAQTILAYFSFRQEPDLIALFTDNKDWYFPRCLGQNLAWHRWHLGADYQSGRYGIKEPLPIAPQLAPNQADLILVPAVACSHQGDRLGYGGGYYDRLFSSKELNQVPTVGIVFDFAYVAQLPTDPWDYQLDFIVTENRFSPCPKQR